MRVTGDLGFSSLVLVVVCVVLPVIGFVIRRKWQVSEARKDDRSRSKKEESPDDADPNIS